MRNDDLSTQWIKAVRKSLAARKNGRPSTKAGAVRALWPEISEAIQNGQTLKSIRDWLEAEGIPLRYSQFTLYVRRIRQKQLQLADMRPKTALHLETGVEGKAPVGDPAVCAEPRPTDPLANIKAREGRLRTFEYSPEFNEDELL